MVKSIFLFLSITIGLTILKTSVSTYSQDKVPIDKIVAVVGNSAVLESELIAEMMQFEAQGISLGDNPMCELLNDVLYQKLLYNQAVVDSVEVSEAQVEQELERRIRFFIQQIGSRERLEEYYGMSIEEIKDDFRDMIREQLVSQSMERVISEGVRATPSEVRAFYNSLPEDSIPIVEMELQLAHIVRKPPVREEEIQRVKQSLTEYRERVLQGERFSTLAILYSEDPGSARRGGELGFYGRGELFPEFEAVAFGLRPGEVSEIVETQAGFHIIQLIERRGEMVNVRHILLQPRVLSSDIQKVRNELDSIRNLVLNNEMSFAEAALEFSEHPSKTNRGVMINPYTGTNRFKSDEMEPRLFFKLNEMEVDQITEPMPKQTEDGKEAFRIIKIIDRREPQKASLSQDYDYIQKIVLNKKRHKVIKEWINDKIPSTYIYIHPKYQDCEFEINWLKN